MKINEISKVYSGVIFSYGASGFSLNFVHKFFISYKNYFFFLSLLEEYKLNIEGENLNQVCSGKEIAQWYNGHFDYSDLPIDFSNIRNVSITG